MDKYLLRTHYEGYIPVELDAYHAELLALKLGQQPGRPGAHRAVHDWLQEQIGIAGTDVPHLLREFIRVRILAEIIQPDLFAKLRGHVKEYENDEWPMQISYLPGRLDELTNRAP